MKKAVISCLLFGAMLSAAPVNVTLLNGGAGDNFEIGPYPLIVNGTDTFGMCMNDWKESYIGSTWSSNITNVNGTDFSNTYLHNNGTSVDGYAFTSQQIYTAEAYLFSKLIAPGADRDDIQEAAWAIMDPATFSSSNQTVQNILIDAYQNSPNFNTAGFQIVSDVNGNNQEFMTESTAPEPASLALMGGGLFLAGAGRFFGRKKKDKSPVPSA